MSNKHDLTIDMQNVIMYTLQFIYHAEKDQYINDRKSIYTGLSKKKINKAIKLNWVIGSLIDMPIKMKNGSGSGDCPFCYSKGNEGNFIIDDNTNTWACTGFNCCGQKGDMFDFVSLFDHKSIDQAKEWIMNMFPNEIKERYAYRIDEPAFPTFENWIIEKKLGSVKSAILSLNDLKKTQ